MIQLTDSLWAVEIESGVANIGAECEGCIRAGLWHCAHADTCGGPVSAIKVHNESGDFLKSIPLPSIGWDIVGIVTADAIDFFPDDYVEFMQEPMGWKNYVSGKPMLFGNSEDSFRSLLESKGLNLANNALHPSDVEPTDRRHYDKLVDEWESAEKSIIKGKIVIIKKIK